MFKLSKKTKLQEIETEKMNENVEKKENIEEIETTDVNSENISENPKSTFPSASTTLENAQKQWHNVTAEEILEKITQDSTSGYRSSSFYFSIISEELVTELTNQGYKVNVTKPSENSSPYFFVYW